MITTEAIILIVKFIALSILFVVTGNVLRNKTNWYENHYGKFFWMATDYFIGLCFYFACVRTLSLIIHPFSICTYVTLIGSVVLCIFNRKIISNTLPDYSKFALIFIPIFIAQLVLVALFWVESDAHISGAFAIAGSLHSPRYANISHYLLITDSIPTLNQNYMQSVMAATPFLWGGNQILVSLAILLSLNISFLWLFIHGFLKRFFADRTSQLFAAILVMCGGLTISFRYFLLVDSGWPWIITGYSDTVVSLASYLITVLLLITYVANKNTKSKWVLVIAGANIICWFAMGIQNVLMLYGIFVVYIIFQLLTHQFNKKIFITLASLLIFCTVIGVLEGGMVTPPVLQSHVKIPGVMTVNEKNQGVLGIQFGLPYYILSDWMVVAKTQIGSVNYRWRVTEQQDFYNDRSLYLKVYGNLAIQVLLIPLCACVLGIGWAKKIKTDYQFNQLIYLMVLTFLGGLAIAFPFTLFYHKWELARFLAPGYFLIAILTAVMVYNWGNSIKPKLGQVALILLTVFLCIGPFDGTYKTIRNNFILRDFKTDYDSFYAPYTDYIP